MGACFKQVCIFVHISLSTMSAECRKSLHHCTKSNLRCTPAKQVEACLKGLASVIHRYLLRLEWKQKTDLMLVPILGWHLSHFSTFSDFSPGISQPLTDNNALMPPAENTCRKFHYVAIRQIFQADVRKRSITMRELLENSMRGWKTIGTFQLVYTVWIEVGMLETIIWWDSSIISNYCHKIHLTSEPALPISKPISQLTKVFVELGCSIVYN